MNVQFGSDEHEAAIQKTLKAAKSAGKTAAIFCECADAQCTVPSAGRWVLLAFHSFPSTSMISR